MISIFSISLSARPPQGKAVGFGIQLGDPTAITLKYWTNNENAFQFYVGNSFFGNLRFGADYLWHFDVFNSPYFKLYAGPGVTVGLGDGNEYFYKRGRDKWYYRKDGLGLGARGLAGVNAVPRNTPIEIYFELGVLIGISPMFGSAAESALGIRFYF